MAKSHKAQHWVPQSYLAAWTDPETPIGHTPYVHVFVKDGSTSKRRAPSNIFKEADLYTIKAPDGGRDLRLERGLSDLERAFSATRREFLMPRKALPLMRRLKLLAFVAAMHSRTPAIRDHHGAFWNDVLKSGEELERNMRTASPAERKNAAASIPSRGSTMSFDAVKAVASSPMEHILGPLITAEFPLLAAMRCVVFCTDSDPGFITSDSPVVWFNPEAYKRPPLFRSPSFSDEALEITFPISHQQCLYMCHGEPGLAYQDVSPEIVADVNRRNRFYCTDEFVVRNGKIEPFWFDPGKQPADTWEATHPVASDDSR